MGTNIKITKIAKSKVEEFDFKNIPPFGHQFTEHMFVADYEDGQWKNFEIKPIERLSLHPANLTLHYGQTIFEGMKAFLTTDGEPVLYRPYDHARRFNKSALRMSMPEVPEQLFVDAISELVKIEFNWIPRESGSALYIRPFMIATDEVIGVKPSLTYKFIIFTMPSGPYYNRPLSLKVAREYVRAVKGGIGEAKTAGNYGASIYPFRLARELGFDQLIWLDGFEHKYVQEIGTMNIFFVLGSKVITPALDGAILQGITRDSILQILKDNQYDVEERLISIDEIVDFYKEGKLTEVFGSGTAAIVADIFKIEVDDFQMDLYPDKFKVAHFIFDYINKVRVGELPDKFNWIYKIP